MISIPLLCPHCQQPENVVKFGKTRYRTQRYQCKSCKKTFAKEPKSNRISKEKEAIIEGLLAQRISYRAIKRAAKAGCTTIQGIAKKNKHRVG
jgi:transposase-like protein